MWVYKILERAIAEAKAAGWLGKNIRNRIRLRTICSYWCRRLFVAKKRTYRVIGRKR
jgi:hypothetical protein